MMIILNQDKHHKEEIKEINNIMNYVKVNFNNKIKEMYKMKFKH